MDDFYRILERIEYGGQRAVLATIVKVEGSSYREHGTSMLLVCDETSTGMLSGGCLESDLKVRAKHWFDMNLDDFERLESILLTYDMRSNDVLSWGRVPGCNGLITVLLEPITSLFRQQLIQIKHQMDRGFGVVSLRKVHNGHCNERAFIFEDGRVIGNSDNFKQIIGDMPFSELCHRYFENPAIVRIIHRVRPNLVIIGAGDDSIPVVELANKTSWTVTVADFRAALCNERRFPHAEKCQVGAPEDLLKILQMTKFDAVILMTHDFQVDQILIQHLLNCKDIYLGVLGPQDRMRRLLKGAPWPDHLHAPIGLPIEAEGPEEIAVSIIAELIKWYRHSIEKIRLVHG